MREKLFFVSLSIAIFLLAVPASGQIHSFDDTVRVNSLSGDAGDTIAIPINLKNTFHVGGYLFRITYDTLAFEPISVDTTSRSSGFEWNGFNMDEPGVIRFFATSMHPVQNAIPPGVGPVSLVTIFIRNAAPQGTYDIRFENEDTTSYDNQLSDSLGTTLIIPVLIDGYVQVNNATGVDQEPTVPAVFELSQNYPNPFNSRTVISFSLALPGDVDLVVYDLLGRKVATLYSGPADAGRTDISWDARTSSGKVLASGIYYYRLAVKEGKSLTRRMTLLK
ncbi:MAG: T9SS type A sorting domain-containing protein [Candidatus Zixiibacteriota bacterium]|nr:MAG: T9SS type A sorting domain-containing protein [candidate division Zixibacteria bacterium]